MGKKGLFITIFCSVAVVLVLGIFNIVNLTRKPSNPDNGTKVSDTINKGSNKGSAEDPYYIYDTETFNDLLSKYGSETKPVRKPVMDPVMVPVMVESTNEAGETVMVEKQDEQGNIVYEQKKDEQGNLVFEQKKDADGNVVYEETGEVEQYHFALYNDIDFSGKEYKILFNDGKAFSGILNGKGFTVKNISVNVTAENLKDNIYVISKTVDETKTGAYAHIALFGDLNGASITNISFDAVSIKVADDIVPYIQSNDFYNDVKTSIKEITIGSLAACAENSTIEANVNAVIDADSYSNYASGSTTGRNCVGGVVGYAMQSTISNLENGKSNIEIVADSGYKNYYMGGVAGYLFNSEIKFVDLSVKITACAAIKDDQDKGHMAPLYIGGAAGYVRTSNINNAVIDLTVNQVSDEKRYSESYGSKTLNGYVNKVAGIVSIIRANDENEISKISNVKVTSNVDMDCYFGGAVYEVKSTQTSKDKTAIYVTLEDLTLNSTVLTLQAYGVASYLVYTEINYTENYQYSHAAVGSGTERQYNVLLNGETTLKSSAEDGSYVAAMICSNYTEGDGILHFTPKQFYVLVSNQIHGQFRLGPEQTEGYFGAKGSLSFVKEN